MNASTAQTTGKGNATSNSKAQQVPVATAHTMPKEADAFAEPKKKEESPTFKNLRDWLTRSGEGREVVIVSPPRSDFTRAYTSPKTENDPGLFNCTLLDVTLDPLTQEPLVALVEYSEKNARKFYSIDLLVLKGSGCQISVPMEMDLPKKAYGFGSETQSKH